MREPYACCLTQHAVLQMSNVKIAEIATLHAHRLAKPGPSAQPASQILDSDSHPQSIAASQDRQQPLVDGPTPVLQNAYEQLAAAVAPQHADTSPAVGEAPSHLSPSKEQDGGDTPTPQLQTEVPPVSPFSETLATASEQARIAMEAQFKLALAKAPSRRNIMNPATVFSWGQLHVLSKQIQACRRLEVSMASRPITQ